jgi:hypothetical protein
MEWVNFVAYSFSLRLTLILGTCSETMAPRYGEQKFVSIVIIKTLGSKLTSLVKYNVEGITGEHVETRCSSPTKKMKPSHIRSTAWLFLWKILGAKEESTVVDVAVLLTRYNDSPETRLSLWTRFLEKNKSSDNVCA